jgi:endonuclease G
LPREATADPATALAFEPLPNGIPGSSNKDYEGSGFDRGHQAPSNDFKSSVKLMEETFFYTNVVPQVGKGFNRGIWKQLEALVRKLAIDRDEIYVITGPVYQEKKPIRIRAGADACGTELSLKPLKKGAIGSDVAVPAALYKIIYDPRLVRVNAYVLPNFDHRNVQDTERDIDYLKRYRVGLGTVEKLTGFTFMTALDDRAHRILAEECPDTMLH